MKNILTILLAFSVLFISSCQDDDDNFGETTLTHATENVSGPFLPAGTHEFLVHFDAADLAQYAGRRLDRIEFFLGELPAGVGVAVQSGSNPNFPSDQVYFRDIGSRVNATGWISHRLAETVTIGDLDLWLNVIVSLDQQQRSVGCDAGPRKTGGDWLLRQQDNDYITFADITGESVNWNIRGILAPEGE